MVDDVDLIVRGRLTDVYLEDIKTTDSVWLHVWAHVSITEVIKGEPVTRDGRGLTVALAQAGAWPWAENSVPDEEVVLFLMNEADYRTRYGQVPVDPEAEKYMYWRPNDQALLRNVDGGTDVADAEGMAEDFGPDRFPLGLVGKPFDEVIDLIVAAVEAD